MKPLPFSTTVLTIVLCGLLAAVLAGPPSSPNATPGNSFHLFTNALSVDESGVVEVPSRYKWSVETSFSGIDLTGRNLPDSRLMLRLYDPDNNFTAITAQMDLETASKLHHELGVILKKKLQDPEFVHRPTLYKPQDIPKGRFKGIDKKGQAIIELEYSTPPEKAPSPTE